MCILFLDPIINYHILENCMNFQLQHIFDYKLNIVGTLKKSKVKHQQYFTQKIEETNFC